MPTTIIGIRDIFKRVVLAQLLQADWIPVSTKSLPVMSELLGQPGAVALSPLSLLPSLRRASPQTHIEKLDIVADPAAMALGQLGVMYGRETPPQWLRSFLAPWPVAGDAGPD